MSRRVAVLGCGPAGLFAAHACRQAGVDVRILAPREPSKITGAQHLHKPIPGLGDDAAGEILYRKMGTRDAYAMKVYGNLNMSVSWDTFDEGVRPYWSLYHAYQKAWELYEHLIEDCRVNAKDIKGLLGSYDLVINTVPLKFLCLKGHRFSSQRVYISNQALHQRCANQIVYNGQREVQWYRWSVINGHSCYEFSTKPSEQRIPFVEIEKPLTNFCDCHPGMIRVGRYGEWKKGKLTHHAYQETLDALHNL